MTKLPKFLALAALAAGCGDFARTGLQPADIFYFPTGLAVGHVPTGCTGGAPGCQTRLYVASSNFDLRYDLKTGGTLTVVDPDTSRRVGEPVRMGSFAGDVVLADASVCPGFSGTPRVLVASRSASLLYGMPVAADGSASCDGCARALDVHLSDPFAIAVVCRPESFSEAWVGFLGGYIGLGWIQPVSLEKPDATSPEFATLTAQTTIGPPTQAMAYDPNTQRVYSVAIYAGATAALHYSDASSPSAATSFPLPMPGEATGLAISADGTRAYVALHLYNALVASSTARPADLGGAIAVLDLTPGPSGIPSGALLRLVPVGLGPSYVRTVDRRALGLRDLVAVTCSDDSTLHLYDDEVGAVMKVVGANERGSPLLGRRPYGLAVEYPYRTATSSNAVRYFVASFDDGVVSAILLDDPARPGSAVVLPTTITPASP